MDTNNTDCCCLEAKPADQEKSSNSWDIKYLLAILGSADTKKYRDQSHAHIRIKNMGTATTA